DVDAAVGIEFDEFQSAMCGRILVLFAYRLLQDVDFKLAGAGGGGFLVLYCPKDRQEKVRQALSQLKEIEFRFDWSGARIAFAQ
ncbi:hypothetical protein ACC672_36900, partial [Rhizobium ruizarguesonis]